MKKITGIILFLFLLLVSCGSPASNPDITERKYSLSYGPDSRNKMDVFLPAGRDENTPFVLLIHGGGWTSGDKSDFNYFQEGLLMQGIASASISYRYVSAEVHYPQLMQDVTLAVDYCTGNADKWVIRKDKYIVCGGSAGAHMGLLYSYAYDPDHRVGAVVSLAGPTDFTDEPWLDYAVSIGQIGGIENMAGAVYTPGQPVPPEFEAASPVKNLKNLPTLLFHGDQDSIVFYTQAQSLDAALTGAGTVHELVTISGAGHDLGLQDQATAAMVVQKIIDWTEIYGK